jgi:hypothetical protein
MLTYITTLFITPSDSRTIYATQIAGIMSTAMDDELLESAAKEREEMDHAAKAKEERTDLQTRSTQANNPSPELTVQSLFGVKGLVAVVTGGGSGTPTHPASCELLLNFLEG